MCPRCNKGTMKNIGTGGGDRITVCNNCGCTIREPIIVCDQKD
jgi:NMD protein affecting ribosome stability and mRNA decay